MNNFSKFCFILSLILFYSMASVAQIETAVSDSLNEEKDPNLELLIAASKGDTVLVKKWIEKGADVNYQSLYEGVSPLMYAAQNGHLETVKILLHAGASCDLMPYSKVDALLAACVAGHVYIADTLIQNGANVNTHNDFLQTPLMFAAVNNDSVMADMLIFYGAKINTKDYQGNTALHYCALYGSIPVSLELIEENADINSVDNHGFTPLMIVSQNGFTQLADTYLKNGANLNAVNDRNLTALSLAIVEDRLVTAELLIDEGADPNHKITATRNQYTLAKEFADKSMQELLLAHGAHKNSKPQIDRFSIGMDLNFNTVDFMVGGNIGLHEAKYGIEAEAGYKTRPWARSVLYPAGTDVFYQFWERRSVFHLGADKLIPLSREKLYNQAGIFGGFNLAISYGNFRGSEKNPDVVFRFVPKAGFYWYYHALNLKLDYEYMDLKDTGISGNRINLTVGFGITFKKDRIEIKKEPIL